MDGGISTVVVGYHYGVGKQCFVSSRKTKAQISDALGPILY
jgi:hypothetical protein